MGRLRATILGTGASLAACGCWVLSADLDLIGGTATVESADAGARPLPSESGTPDTGAPDASADSSDASVVGPNLLPNGTFEDGTDPWMVHQAKLSISKTARGGAQSMLVCDDASPDYFTADVYAADPPVVGATYRASIWVREAPSSPRPPGVQLHLRTSNPGPPFMGIEAVTTTEMVLVDDTWRKLEVELSTTKPAAKLDVFFGSDRLAGACFLVDDVRLERVR